MAKKKASGAMWVEFACTLEAGEDGAEWSAVTLPARVHAALGRDRGRIPVVVEADGHAFRTSAMPMAGRHMFVFNRAMREATGKGAGDRVTFRVRRDTAVRSVRTPADLARALAAHPGLAEFFESMGVSHRREWVTFVEGAKKAETRARRVAKAAVRLAEERAASVAKEAERAARRAERAARGSEAGKRARELAAEAARRAKAAAKEATVIAKVAAKAAAHEYEDRLHEAAIKGATALELGAVKAAGALRGLVAFRRKVRRGGGV